MTSNPRLFHWACGDDDTEHYYGGFLTLDAAWQDARDKLDIMKIEDDERVFVVTAVRAPVDFRIFVAGDLIDRLADHNEEAVDPDGELRGVPTNEQAEELENSLSDAFAVWANKHNLCRAYMLADMEDAGTEAETTMTAGELRACRAATGEIT